jgi:copper chaperone CopZ
MTTEKLNIQGMHCGHCTDLIRNSLSLVKGITTTSVGVGSATVTYDETVTSRDEIEKAITRFGYKVLDY